MPFLRRRARFESIKQEVSYLRSGCGEIFGYFPVRSGDWRGNTWSGPQRPMDISGTRLSNLRRKNKTGDGKMSDDRLHVRLWSHPPNPISMSITPRRYRSSARSRSFSSFSDSSKSTLASSRDNLSTLSVAIAVGV